MARKLSFRHKLQISALGVSVALIMVLDVGFMKYFTDVLGFKPSILSRVLSLVAVITIFSNIFSGVITDKYAKYAKLVKISIFPIAILAAALLFTQPQWDESFVYVFLLAIMIMYDFAKLIFNMNYMAYILNVTDNAEDRTGVSALRNYLGFIPAAINSLVPMLLFTGDFSKQTITIIFLSCIILGFVLSLISIRSIREDLLLSHSPEQGVTFREMWNTLKTVIRNREYLFYFLAILFFNGLAAVYYDMYMYYMDNVMGAVGLMAVLPDVIGAFVQAVIFGVAIKATAKFGTRNALGYGMFITLICYTGLMLPFGYVPVAIFYALSMVGLGMFYTLQVPLLGTIMDLDELQTGKRKSGTILAMNSIVIAVGLQLSKAIFAELLSIVNYDGTQSLQAEEVINGIRMSVGGLGVVLLGIGLVFLFFLPLGKKREQEIAHALEAQRNQLEEE